MDGSSHRFAKLDRQCEDSYLHAHDQSVVIRTRTFYLRSRSDELHFLNSHASAEFKKSDDLQIKLKSVGLPPV